MKASVGSTVIVIGAGSHGGEVRSYIHDLAAAGEIVRLAGFVDENKGPGPFLDSKILGGFRELEGFLRSHSKTPFYYMTATGDNRSRLHLVRKIARMKPENLFPWTLRHTSANVGRDVEMGEGTCLAPGSTITTRVRIGRHCILNVHASISHDCVIGDFVNINPHAAICGNVKIGEGCSIGAGSTVIDHVSIGAWSIVGAGAVVVDDVPSHVTVVGVPAKVIPSS